MSSVLNRDVKQFGKKHLTDDDEETCWNSDQVISFKLKKGQTCSAKVIKIIISPLQGCPQWILINFEQRCKIERLDMKFQGGFVGKIILNYVLKSSTSVNFVLNNPFYKFQILGKHCDIEISSSEPDNPSLKTVTSFYPQDTSSLQVQTSLNCYVVQEQGS